MHVHVAEGADPLQVRNFLYGSGLAALCFRHGYLPLHGSAVQIGGHAVIFSGRSGAGKSTLAAALARRGHRLLCDDVCALDFSGGTVPLLRAAFPRVKLMADAMDRFGLEAATVYTRAALGLKGHFGMVSMEEGDQVASLPVAAIYRLREPGTGAIEGHLLPPAQAFSFLRSQVHRSRLGLLMGYAPRSFRQVGAIASTLPVYTLQRPKDLDRLDETVAFLEQRHESDAGLSARERAAVAV